VGDKSDARTEDRPDRPEVPGARGQADGQPHREHDDDHREIAGHMDLNTSARGGTPGFATARVVATQLGKRQVGHEQAQLGGGVCAERGLQPGLVLVHREIPLGHRLAELVGGLLALAITGPDRLCGWGGHGCLRRRS